MYIGGSSAEVMVPFGSIFGCAALKEGSFQHSEVVLSRSIVHEDDLRDTVLLEVVVSEIP
jgi:hypothetical protein